MRFTEIPTLDLTNVTGGCGKKCCPSPPPPPAPELSAPEPRRSRVSVTVATGAAGGQAIQQALQQ